MTVWQYLPVCWVRMAPEVNEEKGTYASHFYSWFFRKFIRVVFYFSWIFLVTWHSFAQLSACRYLLWLPLTWWWWWIVFVIWFYRRKLFSLISTRDHFQRSSPKQISNTPRAGFEPVLNLNSVLGERRCPVVITTTLRHYVASWNYHSSYELWHYFHCFVQSGEVFTVKENT